jgi:hypothetical protein
MTNTQVAEKKIRAKRGPNRSQAVILEEKAEQEIAKAEAWEAKAKDAREKAEQFRKAKENQKETFAASIAEKRAKLEAQMNALKDAEKALGM